MPFFPKHYNSVYKSVFLMLANVHVWHVGAVHSIVALQHKDPGFDPELGLLSLQSFVGSLFSSHCPQSWSLAWFIVPMCDRCHVQGELFPFIRAQGCHMLWIHLGSELGSMCWRFCFSLRWCTTKKMYTYTIVYLFIRRPTQQCCNVHGGYQYFRNILHL